MSKKEQFKERFSVSGQNYGIFGVMGSLTVCAFVLLLATNYFANTMKAPAVAALTIGTTAILLRFILKKPNKTVLAIEYLALNAVGLVSINYIAHFPSPFFIFASLLAVLIYLDFGASWLGATLALQYGVILLRSFGLNLSTEQIVIVWGIAVSQMAFTIFVTRLIYLARNEVITTQRSNEKAIENQQQVNSLINNMTDGVLAIKEDLTIVVYNAAALDVLDVNTSIKGKRIDELLKPITAERKLIDFDKMLHETKDATVTRELSMSYPDGSVSNLYLAIAPVYLGYGKSANNGYTIILRDITREKSLEEERNEFISVISHELRTPIAIAEGNVSNAEFIADKTGDIPTIKTSLKETHNQIVFLADMMNDLSTLSRAERGTLELDIEPINVPELVAELAKNYSAQASAKGLNLNTSVGPDIDTLRTSKLYTREILQNFITNAIKYTQKGSVTIEVKSDIKGVVFAIKDTGIGIAKSDQQKVFDKFFRSEDFRTREVGGTGLGLYITTKLIKLIQAELELTSELNKGSTFTIRIPNL